MREWIAALGAKSERVVAHWPVRELNRQHDPAEMIEAMIEVIEAFLFRRERMSTTTSVPAPARKLPSGRRIAAIRSADFAMRSRAVASALSIVPCEVPRAASAPGFNRSIDRTMK